MPGNHAPPPRRRQRAFSSLALLSAGALLGSDAETSTWRIAYRAARTAGLAEEDANDCAGEFLLQWSVPAKASLAFLSVCARNYARNWARAARRHAVRCVALGEEVAAVGEGLEDALAREMAVGLLLRALDGLSAETRSLVVRHHLEDVPVAELARSLGITEGAVEGRLFRARAALARRLASSERFFEKP